MPEDLGPYRYEIRDCQGSVVKQGRIQLAKGLVNLDMPLSGLASLNAAK
jgi:hypothetical protein